VLAGRENQPIERGRKGRRAFLVRLASSTLTRQTGGGSCEQGSFSLDGLIDQASSWLCCASAIQGQTEAAPTSTSQPAVQGDSASAPDPSKEAQGVEGYSKRRPIGCRARYARAPGSALDKAVAR